MQNRNQQHRGRHRRNENPDGPIVPCAYCKETINCDTMSKNNGEKIEKIYQMKLLTGPIAVMCSEPCFYLFKYERYDGDDVDV